MSRLLLPIILSIEIRKAVCQINLGTFSLNRNQAGDLQIGLNQMANIFGFGGDRGLQLTTGSGKFNIKSVCQINLGTFSLNRNQAGDLQIGLNQMANIFGFGGDRGLQLTTGSGKFNIKSNQGALIGGERVGVNSRVDVREGQGLDLDSVLNFGNQPSTPGQPTGQFGTFIENISKFFQSFTKQSISPMPTSLSPLSTVELPMSVGRMGTTVGVISPESGRISLKESETPEGSDTSLQQSKLTARGSRRYDGTDGSILKSDAERGIIFSNPFSEIMVSSYTEC
ncbi:hypothetical protein Tcan_12453 [Toxocara canis]|uniref:Uncharacterized protein n=1 Tax=Toxocara canis TaxID=6265 RepID=A0A0B2VEC2_TOXCA|nr:hypothetical protein Tcan_12453 [Toxocara canis]